MPFTDYAKQQGYDKGATLGVASGDFRDELRALKPTPPLGAQLAEAFIRAQDFAIQVERFVDALTGTIPEPKSGETRPNVVGLCGELAQQAHDTHDAIEKAERRLIQLRNHLLGS